MKLRYTQVLKGHLAINMIRFNRGTSPANIELFARAPLLKDGVNYGHGTGHGVGYGTAVHESSHASLTLANQNAFQEGWVISNEPGYYKEGEFGIRIENLVSVANINDEQLGFKQLTFFPYEPDLMDRNLLDNAEIEWINNYHQQVKDFLEGKLSAQAQEWIDSRCKAIPLHGSGQ